MPDLIQPCSWNGSAFVPSAAIPVSDRGFRYGMSIFESLAVRDGKVEFLADHLNRLKVGCEQCGWPVDPAARARAGEWFEGLSGSALARIYVTAGDGAPTAPVTAPRIFLFAEPRSATLPKSYRVVVYPAMHVPVLGGLKTANYWANLEALLWAQNSGFDEALRFNSDGALISACMANVFVVLDGKLVTPHPSTGARRGVVRDWVLQHYGEQKIVQRALTWGDLDQVTECFLTSSWIGVLPVVSLDTRPLQTTLGEALRAEFFSKTAN